MAPYDKPLESADALVALRAIYYSRFSGLYCPTRAYHSRRHLLLEDKGVVGNDYTQVVDSKLIGRQAFLLDEPLRQAHDGKLLRPPLDNTICHSNSAHSRGESTVWGSIDDEPALSELGWKMDWETEGLEGCQKLCTAQGMAMWLSPRLTGVENMNTSVVAQQDQPLVGEPHPEALAEELYRQYIDEGQCCELGGWLNES